MSVVWFLVGAVTALGLRWAIAAALSKRPPPAPRCTAVLQSGEQCVYDAGHVPTYHRARIYVGGYYLQSFVWEDPSCGVVNTYFRRI